MAYKFVDYKVQKATFSLTPDIAPNRNYKISPKIGCNIRRGGNRLVCTFNVDLIKGEEPVPFEFSLIGAGTFILDEGEDASAITVKVAEAVYPFVRQSVAALTQLANIPPYVLPILNMEDVLSSAKRVTLTVPNGLN